MEDWEFEVILSYTMSFTVSVNYEPNHKSVHTCIPYIHIFNCFPTVLGSCPDSLTYSARSLLGLFLVCSYGPDRLIFNHLVP